MKYRCTVHCKRVVFHVHVLLHLLTFALFNSSLQKHRNVSQVPPSTTIVSTPMKSNLCSNVAMHVFCDLPLIAVASYACISARILTQLSIVFRKAVVYFEMLAIFVDGWLQWSIVYTYRQRHCFCEQNL